MAQLVESPGVDFGSGHDLPIGGIEPLSGSALTAQRLLGILSLPLYKYTHTCMHACMHIYLEKLYNLTYPKIIYINTIYFVFLFL